MFCSQLPSRDGEQVLVLGVLVPFHLMLNKVEARVQAGLGHLASSGADGASFDLCKSSGAELR